ncbi:MAG TPA: M1 family metallopeptidase, partial [Gemmatimonadales bacterium]|nr:M1 family metallopeptidase [Gemmatimonadales bacterium]
MLLPPLLAFQSSLAVTPDTLQPRHDALHHDVSIVISDTGTHILGVMQTTWRLRSDEPVEVQLDSVYRVVRVLTDGEGERRLARITFAVNPGGGVYIPHHKKAGDTLTTSIRYHGTPRDGLTVHIDSATGRRTFFADNWPDRAHMWIPLEDHLSDKATVAMHIEVPAGMKVVATGVLQKIDTLPRGRTVWHFQLKQRISPYGIVFGAGPLVTTTVPDGGCRVKCVPLAAVTYPEDSARAMAGPFRRLGNIMDFLSELIGPFPYDRLSHVQSTTMFGGMENPTAIFYNAPAIAGGTLSEETVAHETAHQWFGDAVTEQDWHHLWLSEGFATYYAALWRGHADGDSAFRASMAAGRAAVLKSPATARPIIDPQATNLLGLLNSNNYPKGAWVLHSLRGLIGDSAYHAGIRTWYQTYRDSTALSADFNRIMSAAAGQDLTWYFTQALTQPGYPKLDVKWKWANEKLSIIAEQVQDSAWGLFKLPNLQVRIDG